MQQRSQNLTLDKVRETFEKTELTADGDVKKQGVSAFFKTKASTVTEDKTGEQVQQQEAKDSDEEDEDFNEEEEEVVGDDEEEGEDDIEGWDDDENIVRPSRRSKPELNLIDEDEDECKDKVADLPEAS